jgi:DNA-binding PadR family transcriptional regulator
MGPALDRFVAEGLLTKIGESVYRLTERGTEVCDSILEELV